MSRDREEPSVPHVAAQGQPSISQNESVNDRNRIEQSLESENESVDSVQSV